MSLLFVPPEKKTIIVPEKSKSTAELLSEKGRIKLAVADDTGEYIVLNGKKVYKYRSSTWAQKKYNRLTEIHL
jgi:hypothetical protein